jgi:hypothetical protein
MSRTAAAGVFKSAPGNKENTKTLQPIMEGKGNSPEKQPRRLIFVQSE